MIQWIDINTNKPKNNGYYLTLVNGLPRVRWWSVHHEHFFDKCTNKQYNVSHWAIINYPDNTKVRFSEHHK